MATKNGQSTRASITEAGKTIYLTNKELLAELKRCKKNGQMSETLAKLLMLLCSRYAKKGNFVNYSYNEDMQGYALMMLVRTWNSFDPEKSSNPFAFFTQCLKNSFIQYLKHEKRQRDVRDLMLIDQGLNPSFGYDSDGNRSAIQDEGEYDIIRADAAAIENVSRFSDSPIERDDKGVEIEAIEITEEDDILIDDATE